MRISDSDVFSSSVRGNVRKQNEDSCGVFNVPNGKLYIVCDGMGGHAGGATASKIGVDSIANYFQQAKYSDVKSALADALEYANQQIIEAANETPSLKGMGTTACVLLIQGNEAWIAHCGDSRIYLYCAEQKWLHRITKDHSYVQGLVDQGIITDAEAEHHPNKNRILKALGIKIGCKPTICDQPILPANGDTFLICSDGLSGMVDDEQLQYVLQQNETILNKGQLMIQLALQAGGLDNITTQLIKVSESPHAHSVFVSQNPKERLVAKPAEQSTTDTVKKKSNPLFVKIMAPAVAALLIICGALWIIQNAKKTVPEPYNKNWSDVTLTDDQNSVMSENSPTDIENQSASGSGSIVSQDQVTQDKNYGSYSLEYWEIDPITQKVVAHEIKNGEYQADIEISKICTNTQRNYEYKQTIKGKITNGKEQNIKQLYRKFVDDKTPEITLKKPNVTRTPSEHRVKVEEFKCDLYGKPNGAPNTIEDIQWQFSYYEATSLKNTSNYYDSEKTVKAEAEKQLSNAPDSLLCKVTWYNFKQDISQSKDNKTKYDSYITQKQKEKQSVTDGTEKGQSDVVAENSPNPTTEAAPEVKSDNVDKKATKKTNRTNK